MPSPDLAALTTQLLWAAFLVSCAFGAIVQRTGFCTMGAISDAVTMGDHNRLRQWALAAGVAMLGFGLLAWAGIVRADRALYASHRLIWLSALAGGLVFGFGMVIASGCVSKNLVRLGGGSLKALVVIVVLGLSAFATLRGLTAVWRNATVDGVFVEFATDASLGAWAAQLTGMAPGTAGLLVALVLGGALVAWALAGPGFLQGSNLLAGLGVGGAVLAMWWVSGHLGYLPEHPETLEATYLRTNSGHAEALSFVAPVAFALDWLMYFSDRNKVLTVGMVSVFGAVAGSAVVALAQRSFRWQGFADTDDLAHHLAGAVLMGVGGVTAMGCSIGQGVSGVSTLSATSFIAVAAMAAGALAALKYQAWRLDR